MDGKNVDIAELALFKQLAETSPDFIGICDAQLNPVFVNPAGLEMAELTFEEARDFSVPDYFIESESGFVAEHVLPTAMQDGYWSGELHLRKFKSGGETPILYSVFRVDHPISGAPAYLATISRDLTRQKQDEERQALLLRELDHRVKNSLAVVQAIATQTFRSQNVDKALDIFLGRLQALARSHRALTEGQWNQAQLNQTVELTFAGLGVPEQRYSAHGPPITLSPRLTQALTMTLHELCTNALKHGALSDGTGSVSVSWKQFDDDPDKLQLVWEEKDGPPVSVPEKAGFGSKLINQAIAAEADGSVKLEYRPEGLRCQLEARLTDAKPTAPQS